MPVRVAFFVTQPQLWSADSLCRILRNDRRFSLEIVVFPDHEASKDDAGTSMWRAYTFFKSKELPVRMGFDERTQAFTAFSDIGADIVFYDQPYSELPADLCYSAVARKALVCYVPYGFEVSRLESWCFGTDFHDRAWRIFAQTKWHRTKFFRHGSVFGANVAVVGYPKFDEYARHLADHAFGFWKRGKAAAKRVIWAPHWSFGKDNVINYGTFDIFAETMLALAKQHGEIDWVVKPHQRLAYELVAKGLMSRQDVQAYFSQWNALPNASVYDQGSYIACFQTSDALITDCGSFLPEYLPTGKPILHLRNPNSRGYNDFAVRIVRTLYPIATDAELTNTFERVVVQGDDAMRHERAAAARIAGLSIGGAGERIYNVLCTSLGLRNDCNGEV